MKIKFIILLTTALSFATFAQNKKTKYQDDYSRWSLSLNGGVLTTWGDLKSFNGFESHDYDFDINGGLEFGGSISLTRMTNSWWGVRANFMYGNISGTSTYDHEEIDPVTGDPFLYEEHYSFESYMYTFDMNLVLNPINAFRLSESAEPRKWSLLFNVGLGLASMNPHLYRNNVLYDITPDPAIADVHRAIYIPMGLEFKYQLTQNLDLDLGSKINTFVSSDNIDGHNSGSAQDVVYYNYIGLTWNFGKKGKSTSLVYTAPLSTMYSIVRDVESKMNKLTKDSDGDGVADYFDKDPETPEGVAVDGAGRPLDVDMDGVPDYLDADPFTNKGAKVDSEGRELDSDGDGVPDSRDLEPNTPRGALVDVRGREIKTGNVGDAFLPQVYFAFNSATVTVANRERLATVARVMQMNKNITMKLYGHTDKVGSEEYNKKLGERRAQAVKDYLVKNFNIDASRLSVESKGKSDPMANFNNINRRVEFMIIE
jgi:OmpA-OmpF porin, OOP family